MANVFLTYGWADQRAQAQQQHCWGGRHRALQCRALRCLDQSVPCLRIEDLVDIVEGPPMQPYTAGTTDQSAAELCCSAGPRICELSAVLRFTDETGPGR